MIFTSELIKIKADLWISGDKFLYQIRAFTRFNETGFASKSIASLALSGTALN
jgi:hypothetical protein